MQFIVPLYRNTKTNLFEEFSNHFFSGQTKYCPGDWGTNLPEKISEKDEKDSRFFFCARFSPHYILQPRKHIDLDQNQ